VSVDDAGNKAIGDSFDQVPADLAAHQRARFVRFDGDQVGFWVHLSEGLTDADQGSAGPDADDECLWTNASRKLIEYLRPEPASVLLDLPLVLELLGCKVSRLLAQFFR